MNKIAVFPGSFDPFTIGHEDIVVRALELFDKIIVAIGTNALKKNHYSLEDRKKMIEVTFADNPRISVDCYEGLTVDYCKRKNVKYILRGLRSVADFEFEKAMAQMNREMAPDIESVFLLTSPVYTSVSSTFIRDIVQNGGDASLFVPEKVNLSDYNKG